ncbi:hypothetical protein MMC19_001161 [Ptychographa xylographoides]|nr:hypothetical protein [Ptychographa xylographoides]
MPFQYKRVLVIGATSGIGEALATRFIQEGAKVIAVGRRKEKLEEFVHIHGKDNVSAVPFDITEMEKIPNFVTNVTKTYPDLDCIFMNSGIQRGLDFSKPESVDMDSIQTDTTSGLALIPLLRCANYCASKAALHHWILCLREQLKDTSIKIIELFPPAVQTELHDAKHQPDIKDGGNIGMPLDEFTNEAYDGLAAGNEQVPVGMSKKSFDTWESQRQQQFHGMIKAMSGGKS